MTDAFRPALIAVVSGIAVAAVVLVPFVALRYRRHGRLTPRSAMLAFAILVYALALLSYTLLPLPVVTPGFCAANGVSPQLDPGRFVGDIVRESADGSGSLLRSRALLQVLLNIGLFIPLGVFARRVFGRGLLSTLAIGFAASLLIELTQLTGVWFAFPCAYRLFDVDDLIFNTLGALVGALIAPAFPRSGDGDPVDRGAPTPVTAARRLLGMLCDVSFLGVAGGVLASVYRLGAVLGGVDVPPELDAVLIALLGTVIPALVQLALILRTGRSIGEFVVRLAPLGATTLGGRVRRWVTGIGGYSVLSGIGGLPGLVVPVLVVVTAIAVFRTRGRRGLAYAAAGWDVGDDRSDPAGVPLSPGSRS